MTEAEISFRTSQSGTPEVGAPVLTVAGSAYDQLDQHSELWRPTWGAYDRATSLARHDALATVARQVSDVTDAEIAQGETFIHAAFDAYEGVTDVEPASFAFTVPTRTSAMDDLRNGQFAQEVTPFMPVLNHIQPAPYFVSRWGTSLPPTVIERYQPNAQGEAGAVLYAPISPDIAELYDPKNPSRVLEVARRIVNDAVDFAADKLEVRAIGLGATLPALTNLGRAIPLGDRDVALTTGHAGTVHLIAETAKRLHEQHVAYNGVFGIIGTGAIGSASAQALIDRYPDAKFVVTDINPQNVQRLIDTLGSDRVTGVADAAAVVAGANTIVSAVTTDFQLPEGDYRGKAFIEDSMPTCVPQKTIEAGGGIVAWVIGDDQTANGILTPTGLWEDGGYRFGGSFAQRTNTFGCAGEVAVVSESRDPSMALRKGVKPADVRNIGKLFAQYNIVTAEPQRAGQSIIGHKAA